MLSTNLMAFATQPVARIGWLRQLPLIGLCLAWLVLSISGCADNPGKWPKEKLSEHVKQSLIDQEMDMTEVSLTEREGGGYEGTGKVADGETLKLVVTQDPIARRISWDAEGDRGSFLNGTYELK